MIDWTPKRVPSFVEKHLKEWEQMWDLDEKVLLKLKEEACCFTGYRKEVSTTTLKQFISHLFDFVHGGNVDVAIEQHPFREWRFIFHGDGYVITGFIEEEHPWSGEPFIKNVWVMVNETEFNLYKTIRILLPEEQAEKLTSELDDRILRLFEGWKGWKELLEKEEPGATPGPKTSKEEVSKVIKHIPEFVHKYIKGLEWAEEFLSKARERFGTEDEVVWGYPSKGVLKKALEAVGSALQGFPRKGLRNIDAYIEEKDDRTWAFEFHSSTNKYSPSRSVSYEIRGIIREKEDGSGELIEAIIHVYVDGCRVSFDVFKTLELLEWHREEIEDVRRKIFVVFATWDGWRKLMEGGEE